CCPPNVARILAQVGEFAYAQDEAGVFVVLYGSNEAAITLADGTGLKIRQQTHYPWDGSIRLVVTPTEPATFNLRLRIPAWAAAARLSINSAPQQDVRAGSYCAIERCWSAGDVVELTLPMPARLVEAHPLVEEA